MKIRDSFTVRLKNYIKSGGTFELNECVINEDDSLLQDGICIIARYKEAIRELENE